MAAQLTGSTKQILALTIRDLATDYESIRILRVFWFFESDERQATERNDS